MRNIGVIPTAFTTINDHNSDHNFHDKKLFRIHSCSVATIPAACAPCSPSSNNASKITSPLESDSMYLRDNKLYLIIMVLLKLRPIVLFRLVVRARSKTLVNGNN